jgi:hypothetical protein
LRQARVQGADGRFDPLARQRPRLLQRTRGLVQLPHETLGGHQNAGLRGWLLGRVGQLVEGRAKLIHPVWQPARRAGLAQSCGVKFQAGGDRVLPTGARQLNAVKPFDGEVDLATHACNAHAPRSIRVLDHGFRV